MPRRCGGCRLSGSAPPHPVKCPALVTFFIYLGKLLIVITVRYCLVFTSLWPHALLDCHFSRVQSCRKFVISFLWFCLFYQISTLFTVCVLITLGIYWNWHHRSCLALIPKSKTRRRKKIRRIKEELFQRCILLVQHPSPPKFQFPLGLPDYDQAGMPLNTQITHLQLLKDNHDPEIRKLDLRLKSAQLENKIDAATTISATEATNNNKSMGELKALQKITNPQLWPHIFAQASQSITLTFLSPNFVRVTWLIFSSLQKSLLEKRSSIISMSSWYFSLPINGQRCSPTTLGGGGYSPI